MDLYQIAKQRVKEMLRRAEQERPAKRLRPSRKPRADWMPCLMWEAKRIVGRTRKSSRWSKHADRRRKGGE